MAARGGVGWLGARVGARGGVGYLGGLDQTGAVEPRQGDVRPGRVAPSADSAVGGIGRGQPASEQTKLTNRNPQSSLRAAGSEESDAGTVA